MKHSIEELVALARHYYPAAPWYQEPEGKTETERRLAAGRVAGARYSVWRDMHRRIQQQLPGCSVSDRSFYLQGPASCDGCFWADIELPLLPPDVGTDELVFLVSTLAPYYVIYRRVYIVVPDTAPRSPSDLWPGDDRARHALNFELTAEEEPFARVLASEIERTFGYETLPPEIGKEVIPDLTTPQSRLGRTTIYDCLFMGHW